MYQHCFNPFLIKRLQNSTEFSKKKSFFWKPNQFFDIHFIVTICVVCPVAISEPLTHNKGSDY